MSKYSEQGPFEEKVRAMVEGFRGFPLTTTELVFRGETLRPEQAVGRFHEMLGRYEAVREHEAKHRAAIQACDEAIESDHAFYADAVVVVKSHFGSDAKKLATFGLASAKKVGRSRGTGRRGAIETVTTTVIEELPVGREPGVEVVEVETVIEPTCSRQGDRRAVKRAKAVAPAMPSTGAVPPQITRAAPTKAKSKGRSR
jgi:hypothetical protein